MRIAIANAAEVDHFWGAFSQRLQAMLDDAGGDLSSGDLWQMCRSGNAFLVLVENDGKLAAASIYQFQRWTQRTVLRCLGLVGDDFRAWAQPLVQFAEEMAKQGGATALVTSGREGLQRIYPKAKRLTSTYIMEI